MQSTTNLLAAKLRLVRSFQFVAAFSLVITAAIAIMLASSIALAQADFEKGFQAYQSYHGSDFDTVNLANGNLILNIPLLSYEQLGGLPPVVISIRSNATTFQSAPPFENGPQDTKQHEVASGIIGAPWGQPHVAISPGGLYWKEERIVTSLHGGPGGGPEYLTRFVATDESGATHSLGEAIANHVQGLVPGIMYSVDGSGLMLQPASGSNPPVLVDRKGNIGGLIDPNGNEITLKGPCAKPAGGGDFFDPSLPAWEGNAYGTASATSIVDSVGRVIPNPSYLPPTAQYSCLVDLDASYHAQLLDLTDCGTGQSGNTQYGDTVEFPGQLGVNVKLIFCYDYIPVDVCIPTVSGGACTSQNGAINENWWVLTRVTLPTPDTPTYWTFHYDSYGQVDIVTMPTGATVTYTYTTREACGNPPGQIPPSGIPVSPYSNLMSTRLVASRALDLKDGSPLKVWTYASTIGSGWVGSPNAGRVTVQDPNYNLGYPDGNVTVHTFSLIGNIGQPTPVCGPYETLTQYSNFSGKLLKTVATTYTTTGSDYANPTNFSNYIAMGVFPSQVTTTLGGVTSQDNYTYDSGPSPIFGTYQDYIGNTHPFSFGLLLSSSESDWGSTTPLRTTQHTRLWQSNWNYYSANMIDLPSVDIVFNQQNTQVAQTSYTYDESPSPVGTRGNLTSVTRWLNTGTSPTSHTVYNNYGMPIQKSDPLGHTTVINYDTTNNLYPNQIQSPSTGVTHIEFPSYDMNTGELLSHTDWNGNVTTFQYDNMRRLTEVTYPIVYPAGVGVQTHFSETYSYNDTPHSPNSGTPSFTFTQPTDLTNASETPFVEEGILDALGRKVQTIVGQSTLATPIYTETTYDNVGRVSTVANPHYSTSSPTDGTTTYVYDALSRVCAVGRPDGARVSQAVGCPATAAGDVVTSYTNNLATVADEAGNQRTSQSDALGRMTEVVEAPNTTGYKFQTQYQYDALNNLVCAVQQGTATTGFSNCASAPATWRPRSFVYDSLSRLTSAANPESGTIGYIYDLDGNVTSKTAPSPNQPATGIATVTTTYTYDQLNRLTGKSYNDTYASNAPTTGVTYGYDGASLTCATPIGYGGGASNFQNGHRSSMCFGAGSKSWTYDALGRILYRNDRYIGALKPYGPIVDTTHFSVPTISADMQFIDYFNGDLFKYFYPSGIPFYWFDNVEDAANRVVGANADLPPIGYAMLKNAVLSPDGQIISGLAGAGGASGYAGFSISNSYNNRLQPVTLSATNAAGTPILNLTYNFNPGSDNGNVIQIANGKDGNRTQNFVYDPLNRIQQAYTTGTNWGETYGNKAAPGVAPTIPGIDAWGNLTNRSAVTGKTKYEAFNCAPAGTNNQLTSCFTYDAAGNLINGGGSTTYTYDAENRMISSSKGDSYLYDGDGERIEKCATGATPGSCSTTAAASTGKFYWKLPDGSTLAETDGGGTWKAAYGLIGSKIVSRVDLPVTKANPDGVMHYYFSDHLKSASIVTDDSGNIEDESDYYPYGGEIVITNTDTNRYKFTGKERDSETTLDYFGARYYASTMSRFMTPDFNELPEPIPYAILGNPQTLNLYSYVQNNPLNHTDPLGHGGNQINLGGKVTMRVDTGSADQVNIHIKDGNSAEVRGRLDPVEKKIVWTNGKPSAKIAAAAQQELLTRGKYDIAAAKQEMSILGGTRGKGEADTTTKLGEVTNKAFALMTAVSIVSDAVRIGRVNSLEGITGFHLAIDGSMVVTNLEKYGDTFGAGTTVSYDGSNYMLTPDDKWLDTRGSGAELQQDKSGDFKVVVPEA